MEPRTVTLLGQPKNPFGTLFSECSNECKVWRLIDKANEGIIKETVNWKYTVGYYWTCWKKMA
jgi:hypothetical protein